MNKNKEKLLEKSGKNKEKIDELIESKINEFNGLVTEKSAPILVAKDLNIELNEKQEINPSLEVENIVSGVQSVNIKASIRGVKEKHSFDGGNVRSIVIGDETGNTQVSFWDDRIEEVENFDVGDKILIKGGYTKNEISDWQKKKYGVPAVNIGNDTTISKITDEQGLNGGEN